MYLKYKKYKEYPDRVYLQVVESIREGNYIRKKTILSFGRIDNGDALPRVNSLLKTLLPVSDQIKEITPKQDIHPLVSKQYGPLLIFKQLWKQIGFGEVLKESFDKTATVYDLEQAIFNLVLNRLVAPTSKRRMGIFQDSVYGITKFEQHQYYRAMDYLIDHKEDIEKGIYNKMLKQHKGKITMALYDTTSLVYYGDDPKDNSELLNYGFSKARRGDLKQIVVGVLMSQDGIPLGHETYAGNTSDVKCFEDIINKAVDKYGIKRVIFIGDRGMISNDNIKLLEDLEQEYILGYRMRTISKKERPEIFKKVNLKKLRNSNLQYKEVEYKNKRLLFYYNKERAVLDAEFRERILERLRDKIKSGKIKNLLESPTYLKYLDDVEGAAPKISDKKVDQDKEFDGVFVLTSNAMMSAPEIVDSYRSLWQIEQGFKQLKSELKLGPIYHYTDKRIRSHVFICFLALILRRLMLIKLNKKYKKKASYADCIDDLKQLSVVEMKVKDEELHLLTEIKKNAKKMFSCLKMNLPEKILYQSNPEIRFVGPA